MLRLNRNQVITLAKNCGVKFLTVVPGSEGDVIQNISIDNLIKLVNGCLVMSQTEVLYTERERCLRIANSCKSENELINLVVEQIADGIENP